MRKIILTCIILQLLYLDRRVESLKGSKVSTAGNGEFPYVAYLQLRADGTKFCTGTLITRRYVITAAQCIGDKKPKEIQVTFDVSNSPETATTFKVASFLTYEKWAETNRKTKEAGPHYIAVLQLKDDINQADIHPISLSPSPNGEIEGKEAVITGWHGDQLQKASVNILNNKDCERDGRSITNRFIELDTRFLCSAAVPGVSTEKGDGGAPLVGDDDTLIGVNIGIISGRKPGNYSDQCAQQYQMNLHASVSYYWYFIVSATDYH